MAADSCCFGMRMTLDELVNLVSSNKARPGRAGPSVRIDSRLVKQGDIFVAIAGTVCDGHDFIDQAVANGAGYVVCHTAHAASHYAAEAPPEGVPGGTCGAIRDTRYETILVDDSAAAAGMLAQAAAGSPAAKLTNLAVTGTNGKTTIGFLVRSVINQTGSKCGLIGTVICDACSGVEQEAVMTTPDCLAVAQMTADMVANGAEYMVIEASSHALSQNRLAGVEFKAAAFTNLTGDHFDYHKTEEAYLAAKTKLFTGLAADAVAVLNRQSPHAELIGEQTKARILWYAARTPPEGVPYGTSGTSGAIDAGADITAHIESMNTGGTKFTIEYAGLTAKVKSPLLGLYNVSNCLAAAGLCLAAGFDLKTVARGLSSPQAIPGRLEQVAWPGDFTVLIDYAHTDDALKNVLTTLKPLCRGRLIVVFGCGGDRDRTKRPRMARVAEQYGDFIVVTSDNPRTERPEDIINEIIVGFESGAAIAAPALRGTRDEGRGTSERGRET
ncbi:MAG TPA: UDP-N-acetylmuramoyl-L-alanyl-D-glutamate--2,6-diaminopimelate ligase, partial [Sedimentisphaerales bacterium]|nr:UDP-N-acetylmuramoyl-L-alanyl-D-glutamate--2,6-diaminopimelate ligase [Sedimentisphaerales bacterium]